MDDTTATFEKLLNFMEQENKGAQIGCYSIALLGLTVAVRRVRPFTRFKRPSDIPNRFVRERKELIGVVDRVEPNGALLMIHHKPLLSLFNPKNDGLPVKVAGVDVNSHGISWLQFIVAGNEVQFIPVVKQEKFLECEVILPQFIKIGKKEKIRHINVGEALVSIGFGSVSALSRPLPLDPNFRYYLMLKHAEDIALRKKLGYKYYIAPTKLVLMGIINKLMQLIVLTKQKFTNKPKRLITKLYLR